MRVKTSVWIGVLVAAFMAAGGSALAQDGGHGDDAQDAAMEAMIKAGTPGEAHTMLQGMAGTWTTTMKMWAAPGQPPMEVTGRSVITPILGGRFIQEDHRSEFMGSFQGMGVTGYDNVTKEFVSTWIDNMSTSITRTTGTYDNASKTFTYTGAYNDPIVGAKEMKMTVRVIDDKKHVAEFWDKIEGKVVKTMEIVYTRN